VVLTFDDAVNTMRLYINGVQVSQNTGVTQSYISQTERIGAHFTGVNPISFWDGKIAEVRVYTEALAAEDVLANYNNTKTRYGL
jgi:ketosteroid isomerase-like protein